MRVDSGLPDIREEIMKTKERVLLLLERNRGGFLSGQEIANQLSVTRAGVWKAVKQLQEEGYEIRAVTNKGYMLEKTANVISTVEIREMLHEREKSLVLRVEKSLDSTNTELKRLAVAGEQRDMVLLAEEQKKGRGKEGRDFFSPAETGLYLSILLHPHLYADQAILLTTAAATAVARAIEKVTGKTALIQWVNDIWVNGKKAGGILTEVSASLEDGKLEYVIIGIGIHVQQPKEGFPEELSKTAGTVLTGGCSQENLRNRMAAEILNYFMEYYRKLPDIAYLEEYRKRCFVLGKEICICTRGIYVKAKALDLDDSCRLLVQYEDGKKEYLSGGEIVTGEYGIERRDRI